MKRTRIFIAGIATVVILAGCGSTSVSDVSTAVGDIVDTVDSAISFNDSDVEFAQMMIPHHEQAIEMSDIALDPTVGASSAVKALATKIKGEQDPEITVMKGFLTAWKANPVMDHSSGGADMMTGMLTVDEIAALSNARGTAFDQAFVAGMIAHHEGAIDMANTVVGYGENSAVRTLAQKIIAAQTAEITELKKLLS